MKALDRYLDALLNEISEICRDTLAPRNSRKLGQAILEGICSLEYPSVSVKRYTERERVIVRLFKGTREVLEAYEALRNIPVFIRRFPFVGTNISRLSYLRFVIESYLNEMYLLAQRLKAYLNTVTKIYKRSERRNQIKVVVDRLSAYISKSLEGVLAIRGAHVHESRYEDKDFRVLSLLEFMVPKIPGLKFLYDLR